MRHGGQWPQQLQLKAADLKLCKLYDNCLHELENNPCSNAIFCNQMDAGSFERETILSRIFFFSDFGIRFICLRAAAEISTTYFI